MIVLINTTIGNPLASIKQTIVRISLPPCSLSWSERAALYALEQLAKSQGREVAQHVRP